jgi:hypothetical protein
VKRALLLAVLLLPACASWSDATPESRAQALVAQKEKDQQEQDEKTVAGGGSLWDLFGLFVSGHSEK